MATPTSKRLRAAPVIRNRDPILEVLKRVLPQPSLVLEIASGTGEHATYIAPKLNGVMWQPTEPDPLRRDSIDAWAAELDAAAVLPALELDVMSETWPVRRAHAAVCINMIHVAPWEATVAFFAGLARTLPQDGVVVTYGPYKVDGEHTAPSNARFDRQLKLMNQRWGVRDVAEIERVAWSHGFVLSETVDMPANNKCLVFVHASERAAELLAASPAPEPEPEVGVGDKKPV